MRPILTLSVVMRAYRGMLLAIRHTARYRKLLDSPPSTQAVLVGLPPDSSGLRARQVAELVASAGTPG